MSEHKLTEVIKGFYNEVVKNLDFVCEVNDHQMNDLHRGIIEQLSPETMKRYYGSGFLVPEKVEGFKIVDLGSGSGSLVFVLSKLVGPSGYVIGFDITPNQVSKAIEQSEYHFKKWGYDKPNFEFRIGNIEQINTLGLQEKSMDHVVSNGAICLCPNQAEVFETAFKLLKDGGEFSLSDVYADRERPEERFKDLRLFSLGTTGCMRFDDLEKICDRVGFTKPYLVNAAPVSFSTEEQRKTAGNAEVVCAEWRLFKLPAGAKRSAAEVTYNGNITGADDVFRWDVSTVFKKGTPITVDSDLATILENSRFKDSFAFKDTSDAVMTPSVCISLLMQQICVP
ncbi:hypothetical protein LOTGIDRAFT_167413 [Lottia gigantea]|uniref:Arsenite methyltransferase n=1 Tax=Lottia gigantea TaxID=225164 RepID=V3ZUC0_LOTGI|nr:hypothetical protein LOTGIDRAFT_167413 [Lottia gigantea]ESO86180.1 hypothetical protein LOTGIDRAFT_167413 [Lottia gigantea]